MNRRSAAMRWVAAHAVDGAFTVVVLAWVLYALRITTEVSYWSDDLFLLEQSRSWGGLFEPYNLQLSAVPLAIYRVLTELWGMTYTPIMVAGVLSLAVVPIAYFATARRRLGAIAAALLSLPLVWFVDPNLQPSGLSHYLMLAGAIVCGAALERGPRADLILAGALAFSLAAAGGGVVVAAACLAHCLLARPTPRRWLAVVAPLVLWVLWWWLAADATQLEAVYGLTADDAARVVRDLCLAPFYAASLGIEPIAWALVAAYLFYGATQLRRGLRAGASFLAWTAAIVIWAVGLVRSRGILADPQEFRYVYVATGFALLAVVPRHTIRWPERTRAVSPWVVAAGVVLVLVLGGVRAVVVRDDLQDFAQGRSVRGREADGTLLVLGLGPDAIPGDATISFFGFGANRGSAARLRELVEHYGSPFEATAATADRELVERGIARSRLGPRGVPEGCQALETPLSTAGVADHGGAAGDRAPLRLWARTDLTVEVRRFGDEWVPLIDVPEGGSALVTLPALNSPVPWEIRAEGACLRGEPG